LHPAGDGLATATSDTSERAPRGGQSHGVDTRTLAQIGLAYATAHGKVARAYLDPTASDDTKMLAAAIVEAGSQIALALTALEERLSASGPGRAASA